MEAATILALINAAAQFTQSILPLVEEARVVLNSNDRTDIRTALVTLQEQNDSLHERVQMKLRTAPS